LYVSTPILEEYAAVLSRPDLSIRKGLRLQLLQLIKNHGHLVAPSGQIEVRSEPDDNIFVGCADAARADFLITGNRKHFPVFWKNAKISSPLEFDSLVAPNLLSSNRRIRPGRCCQTDCHLSTDRWLLNPLQNMIETSRFVGATALHVFRRSGGEAIT
jgi:hypothetical protein